jgi:hypothetical protein
MLKWTFECDGAQCGASQTIAAYEQAPTGWLVRTIVDRLVSLEAGATGTGFPSGRSELERTLHYCSDCRRKLGRAA